MIVSTSQKIRILEKYFKKADTGQEAISIAFKCPICKSSDKSKKKLVVRIADGWYHCWVCGLSGKSYYSLFKKTFPQALGDPDCTIFFDEKPKFIVSQEVEVKVELPSDSILVGLDESHDPDVLAVKNYLKERGLTKGDMLRWRICASKSGKLMRRVIIPSFDSEGELNYFISRSISDKGAKYINADKKRTEIIFNEIDVDWTKPILLVEGVFDALKCPENTIPVLTSELSKDSVLFQKLWQNRCQVTVGFDPDLKAKSHKTCEILSKAGLEVFQVWAPEGKDFGKMTKEEVLKTLQGAKPWMKESKLFFKINNIVSGSLL